MGNKMIMSSKGEGRKKRPSNGNKSKKRGQSMGRRREKGKISAEQVYWKEWPRGNKGHAYQKL